MRTSRTKIKPTVITIMAAGVIAKERGACALDAGGCEGGLRLSLIEVKCGPRSARD